MEANKIKLSTVFFSIIGMAAVEIAARLLINQDLVAHLTVGELGPVRIAQIIFLLVLIKIQEKSLSPIGLTSTGAYQGIKKGLTWAVLFGAAAGLALLIIYLFDNNVLKQFQMQLPADRYKLIVLFLVGGFIAPVAEEIFFRGILYGFFRKWGMLTALVLSTLLFVLSHPSIHTIPVTQIIGGILFAVAYEIEKNLLVPITIHVLGNLAIFTLALIT
jgi:membrane protease YdiL (CAAX protease family)